MKTKLFILYFLTALAFSCSDKQEEEPKYPVLPDYPVYDIDSLILDIESVINPLIEMIPDTVKSNFESKYILWEETFWRYTLAAFPLHYYPNSEEFKDLCNFCKYFEKGLWPLAIKKIVSNRTEEIIKYYPQEGRNLHIIWYHHLLMRELGEPVYGRLFLDILSKHYNARDINNSVIFVHLILKNEKDNIRRAVDRFDIITYK